MRFIRRLWPNKLKNRIFVVFVLVVFVPFFYTQLRSYNQIEEIIGRKISEQNVMQLELLKNSMESARLVSQNSIFQIEHDEHFQNMLRYQTKVPEEERRIWIEDKLASVKNQYLPESLYLHYTILDIKGEVYTSFPVSESESGSSRYDSLRKQFNQALSDDVLLGWELHTPGDWLQEVRRGEPFLSVLSRESLNDEVRIRVSFNLQSWLIESAKSLQVKQNFYLFDGAGKVITQTGFATSLDQSDLQMLLRLGMDSPKTYIMDSSESYLWNSVYIPVNEWYIVSRFPLDFFFGDIQLMKQQLFLTMIILTIFFIGIAFLTLSTLMNPLRLLEKNMRQAADKRLNIRLPEANHRGEILSLVRTFNGMLDDVSELIWQLRKEERQKEALRFQMLLAQMNPHFLLNTLNAIKWNARNNGDATTAEMCRLLGKLLESSLNTDVDLIHLHDELELVKAYLHIESFRFDQVLQVSIDCEPDLMFALVPKLSLQPIAENAIKHGLVYRKKDGYIHIHIYRHSNDLIMEIRDNGAGMNDQSTEGEPKRKGIGISNLRERLSLLFKEDGRLEIAILGEGTMVRIMIPLLISAPYQPQEEG